MQRMFRGAARIAAVAGLAVSGGALVAVPPAIADIGSDMGLLCSGKSGTHDVALRIETTVPSTGTVGQPVQLGTIRIDVGLPPELVRRVSAASPAGAPDPELAPLDGDATPAWKPGTINIVVAVPVELSDAALVNAVVTATEAKTQALLEAGFPCTGTASDAICVAAAAGGTPEVFGGPRSTWGARIARTVHAAVRAGALDYASRLEARG